MYIYITERFHSGYIRLQTVPYLVQNGKYLIIQRPSVTQLPVGLHEQSDLALLCRLFICSRSSPIYGTFLLQLDSFQKHEANITNNEIFRFVFNRHWQQ